ncbi:MAG: YdcH family protein, partial [Microvirga sp.]
ALEREIQDAMGHPSIDDLKIAELKRRKLQLKDEITKLRGNGNRVIH